MIRAYVYLPMIREKRKLNPVLKLTLKALCVLSLSSVQTPLTAADFGALPDPYTGNWEGTRSIEGRSEAYYATIIRYKQGYEVSFRSDPNPRTKPEVVVMATVEGGELVLPPTLGLERSKVLEVQDDGVLVKASVWQGQISDHRFSGTSRGSLNGPFSMERQAFEASPTLGEKAPSDAVVLFDGSNLDAWESSKAPGDEIQWLIGNDRLLEVVSKLDGQKRKQDIRTKALFRDYKLHLEFKLPYKPTATGQGRANSGIFHLGLYETQILDSFGLWGRDNECGGIYKIREPDSNEGYPPGLWQTYDIEMKAPRFDASGEKVANARITVFLNGKLIHDAVELPNSTWGGYNKGKESSSGPIILQDHGNPVQYRNIWIRNLGEN